MTVIFSLSDRFELYAFGWPWDNFFRVRVAWLDVIVVRLPPIEAIRSIGVALDLVEAEDQAAGQHG